MVVLTNASGNKTKSYSYNAFGVEYNESTLDDNPFRYCGEYYDKETKTIYLRARYYDPAQGRFTQQDGWEFANPEDPLSLNLYTYCWNNPIKYDDSNGHYARTADYYTLKENGLGGAGGGGALLVAAESLAQLAEKADQGLAKIGNALAGAWNGFVDFCATQVDNIARIAADGNQALKNVIDKISQDFNNNTTNPPDPNNLPDPNNWQPGDRFYATVEQVTPGEYQKHHVLSKDIMTALENSNAKGAFERNDFLVRALTQEAHWGYQDWHRKYVEEIVKWINERKDFLTPKEFIDYLNEIYSHQDMIDKFGIVIFTYGG